MPRRDELDDDDDRPRSRRSRHDEEFPSRRRRMDDDDERPRRRKSEPKKSNAGVIVGIIVGVFVVFCGGGGLVIYWAVQGVKKGIDDIEKNMQAAMAEAEAEHSADNLEQIGKAIRKYESVQRFLPNNSYDDTGKPLLSWRVHILPFLGDDDSAELYRRFRLNEPWDSPHNRQVLNSSKMPFVYHHQFDFDNPGQTTFYRGFCHSVQFLKSLGTASQRRRSGSPAAFPTAWRTRSWWSRPAMRWNGPSRTTWIGRATEPGRIWAASIQSGTFSSPSWPTAAPGRSAAM